MDKLLNWLLATILQPAVKKAPKLLDLLWFIFKLCTMPVWMTGWTIGQIFTKIVKAIRHPQQTFRQLRQLISDLLSNPIGTMKKHIKTLPYSFKWFLAYFFTIGKSIPSAGLAYFSLVKFLTEKIHVPNIGAKLVGFIEIFCNFIVCWRTRGRKIREYFGMQKGTMNQLLAYLLSAGWVHKNDKNHSDNAQASYAASRSASGESTPLQGEEEKPDEIENLHWTNSIKLLLNNFSEEFYRELIANNRDVLNRLYAKDHPEYQEPSADNEPGRMRTAFDYCYHHLPGCSEEVKVHGKIRLRRERFVDANITPATSFLLHDTLYSGAGFPSQITLPGSVASTPGRTRINTSSSNSSEAHYDQDEIRDVKRVLDVAIRRAFQVQGANKTTPELADDDDFILIKDWLRRGYQVEITKHPTPFGDLLEALDKELKKKAKKIDHDFFLNHGWTLDAFIVYVNNIGIDENPIDGDVHQLWRDYCAENNVTDLRYVLRLALGLVENDNLSKSNIKALRQYLKACRKQYYSETPDEFLPLLKKELAKPANKRDKKFFSKHGIDDVAAFVGGLDETTAQEFYEKYAEAINRYQPNGDNSRAQDEQPNSELLDLEAGSEIIELTREQKIIVEMLKRAIVERNSDKSLNKLLLRLVDRYNKILLQDNNKSLFFTEAVGSIRSLGAQAGFNDILGEFLAATKEEFEEIIGEPWYKKFTAWVAWSKNSGDSKNSLSHSRSMDGISSARSDHQNESGGNILQLLDELFNRTDNQFFYDFYKQNPQYFTGCSESSSQYRKGNVQVDSNIASQIAARIPDPFINSIKDRIRFAYTNAVNFETISDDNLDLVRALRSAYEAVYVKVTPLHEVVHKLQDMTKQAEKDTGVKELKNKDWLKALTFIVVIMGIIASLGAGQTAYLGGATVINVFANLPFIGMPWLENALLIESTGVISAISSFLAFATFQVDAIPKNLAQLFFCWTKKGREDMSLRKGVLSILLGIWITLTIGFRTKYELANSFAELIKRFKFLKVLPIDGLIIVGAICNVVATFGAQVTKFMTTDLKDYKDIFKDLPKQLLNKIILFTIAGIGFADSLNYSAGCPISTQEAADDVFKSWKGNYFAIAIYWLSGFVSAFTTSIAFTWYQGLMLHLKSSLRTSEAEAEAEKKRQQNSMQHKSKGAGNNNGGFGGLISPLYTAPNTPRESGSDRGYGSMGPATPVHGGGDNGSGVEASDNIGLADDDVVNGNDNNTWYERTKAWLGSWFEGDDDFEDDAMKSAAESELLEVVVESEPSMASEDELTEIVIDKPKLYSQWVKAMLPDDEEKTQKNNMIFENIKKFFEQFEQPQTSEIKKKPSESWQQWVEDELATDDKPEPGAAAESADATSASSFAKMFAQFGAGVTHDDIDQDSDTASDWNDLASEFSEKLGEEDPEWQQRAAEFGLPNRDEPTAENEAILDAILDEHCGELASEVSEEDTAEMKAKLQEAATIIDAAEAEIGDDIADGEYELSPEAMKQLFGQMPGLFSNLTGNDDQFSDLEQVFASMPMA